MKYVDALCYLMGAFLWPWCAGLMFFVDWFCSAVLLAWSFVAWWKIVKWLKMVKRA